MKLGSFLIFIALYLVLLFGCSMPVAESLLTNGSTKCDVTTNISCLATDPVTTSALVITPESLNVTANVDKGDTVEITGTCTDQGRRKNRILVEVFAGDLNEAVNPYISTDEGSKCFDSTGAPLTSAGIATGANCFWVTKGIGLTEDASGPAPRTYPQCHNGQFGFSVRLGKILQDTGLGLNYLVRVKLRTEEGGITESPLVRVVVSRKLTPPSVDTAIADPLAFKCTLKNSIARFNQNISYVLSKSFTIFGTTMQSAPTPVTGYNPLTSANASAFDFDDLNLVDGVTYSYSLTGTDLNFAYAPTAPTAISNTLTCKMSNPILQPAGQTATTCALTLKYANFGSVKYQVASGGPNWTGGGLTPSNPPPIVRTCAGAFNAAPYTCTITGLTPSSTFVFATRAYNDTNGNNNPDVGEEVGYWSNESTCVTPAT